MMIYNSMKLYFVLSKTIIQQQMGGRFAHLSFAANGYCRWVGVLPPHPTRETVLSFRAEPCHSERPFCHSERSEESFHRFIAVGQRRSLLPASSCFFCVFSQNIDVKCSGVVYTATAHFCNRITYEKELRY